MGEEFTSVNSNIEKRIIKKGKFGRKPCTGWKCNVVVEVNEQKGGDNCEKNWLEITIGNGCTLKDRLIEQCLETMYCEEESLFILKLKTDDSPLKVTITLLSFEEKPLLFQWTDAEKIEASNAYKALGGELFKNNQIEEAFYKFSLALKFALTLDSVLEEDDPGVDVNNLLIALYNNLAGCQLHFKNYDSVIKLCNNSINIKFTSKALYRRAVAFIELNEYEKAENDLVELLKMEPKNTAALEKYKLVRELDRTNRENYQSILKKMFS